MSGDIADWTNDCMQDAHPDWCPVGAPRRSAYGPPLTCKACGATGLYWQRVKGEHRIHDRATLLPHVCSAWAAGVPDTFEAVPE